MSRSFTIRPGDRILERYGDQLAALGGGKGRVVLARALDHTGRKAYTAVRRALREQTSAPSAIIGRQVRYYRPSQNGGGDLTAEIRATGNEIALKSFAPRQIKAGVRTRVWGSLQTYEGTFMGPRPGVLGAGLHGHVWVRSGKSRLPIEKVFGPSLPKEMVKGESAAAFELTVSSSLVGRVEHELGQVLPR